MTQSPIRNVTGTAFVVAEFRAQQKRRRRTVMILRWWICS